jgi:formylmethanofuran--tetrahydromethanopterin N-formyltransferase
MQLGPTRIVDTFAEAFRMRFARLVITACDPYWLDAAVREATGYASSVIGCDAEAGVERLLAAEESPDGRPAAAVLLFGFQAEGLAKALVRRVGQSVMTCPTTAVFNGLPAAEEQVPLGRQLRFFGDGFQKSKVVGGRRFWRIPVMDGEFLVEDQAGVEKGVAGGNLIFQGATRQAALDAARRAIQAVSDMPGVIAPFPGGAVRSGSKVGSRYRGLVASTNQAFCPTLRGRVESELAPEAQAACEIVLNGVDEQTVARAMQRAMEAAAGEGVPAIAAGNYGGKLGKFHLHLRRLTAS